MGWLMARVIAWLRPWGRRGLAVLLWRPWLSPVVALVLLAAAGHFGAGWLIGTGAGLGLLLLGTVVGLAWVGSSVSPSGR
jgi:hypothetical protein